MNQQMSTYIIMNARLCDPEEPLPDNIQSYNHYTYCLNNCSVIKFRIK